jgi:hypothetical protein
MNKRNLILSPALVAAVAASIIALNATEPVLSPKARADQMKAAPAAVANPNLPARNSQVAASPKVLANFPQLAPGHEGPAEKAKAACTCCKR